MRTYFGVAAKIVDIFERALRRRDRLAQTRASPLPRRAAPALLQPILQQHLWICSARAMVQFRRVHLSDCRSLTFLNRSL